MMMDFRMIASSDRKYIKSQKSQLQYVVTRHVKKISSKPRLIPRLMKAIK